MTQIFRVVTEWSGFRGGPGYTNFFFRNIIPGGAPSDLDELASAELAHDRTWDFWTPLLPSLPDDVTLTVQSAVDILEDTTGALTGSVNAPALAAQAGTNAGNYSAPVGGVITWTSGTIRGRRRMMGRTFLVPMAGGGFTPSGALHANQTNAMRQAAAALQSPVIAPTFGIWGRPTAKGASDGVWAPATGFKVNDRAAVLRSRRD